MSKINETEYDEDGIVYVGDGGDALNIMGTIHFFFELRRQMGISNDDFQFSNLEHYHKVLDKLYLGHGVWARYTKGWTTGKLNMSRDQVVPNKCLWLLTKDKSEKSEKSRKANNRFNLWHILRLGFFTNWRRNGSSKLNHGQKYRHVEDRGLHWWEKLVLKYGIPGINVNRNYRNYNIKIPADFSGPSFWALVFNNKLFHIFGDIHLILGSLLWRYKKDDNICNHGIIVCYRRFLSDNIFSVFAYKLVRPVLLMKWKKWYYRSEFPDWAIDIIEPVIHKLDTK